MTDSLSLLLLKTGEVFNAFFQPLLETVGNFVYSYIIGVLWLAMYIRTKSVGVPTIWLMWMVYLYGSLFPGNVSSGIMTVCLLGGLAGIYIQAYSAVK